MAKLDTKVKFLRGTQAQLPQTGIEGSFYLTTDTNRLYVGKADNSLALLNQTINIIATQNELPKDGGASLNDFYFITEGNILAFYNGTSWVQINQDHNTELNANSAALTTTVANNVASIEMSLSDTNGHAVSGVAKIKAGSDNVSIVKDGDAISVAVATPDSVDFSIGTKDEGTDNQATVVLSKQIGTQTATEDSLVTLKGNNFVTVESDAAGVITLTGKDQTATGVTNAFDANGAFTTTVDQNGTQVKSTGITPIVKVGNSNEEFKFISGAADLPVYTMTEIDNKLAEYELKANAMTYKGTIAKYADLPKTGQEAGDMYMLSAADGTYEQGDLFIWNVTTSKWDYVPAGDDVDTTYTFTATGNGTNSFAVSELGTHKGSIAVKSGNLITAAGEVTGNDLAITVNHNEVTRNDGTVGTKAQSAKNTLEFVAVESVTTDASGHVSAVKTNTVTVTDTHNELTGVTMAASDTTAKDGVNLVTTVNMTDGSKSSTALPVTSETLVIKAANDGINAELVWESFQ